MKFQFYFSSFVDDNLEFFDIYFHEQILFQIFVANGDSGQFYLEIIVYEQYSVHLQASKFLAGHGFNILTQNYFSEE